jgi:hypothetical protein
MHVVLGYWASIHALRRRIHQLRFTTHPLTTHQKKQRPRRGEPQQEPLSRWRMPAHASAGRIRGTTEWRRGIIGMTGSRNLVG